MDSQASEAYEALCHAHINVLQRYLFHKVSNPADREDLLQDILLAAYSGFDRLKDKALFKSWLIGIASNKCVDYYKAKAKRLEIPLDEIHGSAADHHGVETALMVNDALGRLREKDKQILYLFYLRGYNQKDIAAKLGIPLGTVKSRISAAKENFKTAYLQDEKESL
jgi:RNA polymerase sigma-70 factor (ECF subfamily)